MNVELEKIVKQQGILFSNINNHFLTKKAELNSDIMPDYLHPHILKATKYGLSN